LKPLFAPPVRDRAVAGRSPVPLVAQEGMRFGPGQVPAKLGWRHAAEQHRRKPKTPKLTAQSPTLHYYIDLSIHGI
jgi:hypothetical protein